MSLTLNIGDAIEQAAMAYQREVITWLLDTLERNRMLNYSHYQRCPEAVMHDTALAERIRALRQRLHPDSQPVNWAADFYAKVERPDAER